MSKDRVERIDFNVADIVPFVEAQEELLGENNSFPLVAFGTLKTRSAFKMLCKVNGDIPVDLQNEMSKKIEEYERDLKHAEEGSADEIKIEQYLTDPKLKQIYDNGNEFFGIRVDRKRHASAFCIADHDVAEIFGLLKTPAGDVVLNLEGRFMDELGYVKLDWLIVNVVDMIKVVYDEIGIPVPSTKELRTLVENDKPTWDIYKNGITCCVNQVEQKKTRAKVMKYAPQTVEELTSFVAAVRPSFQSYYHRFERREHFSFGLEALDKLLQGEFLSDSWILYQEQIMLLVIWLGFDVGESANLMKAISKKKKDKIMQIKPVFEKNCVSEFVAKGDSEEVALQKVHNIWQVIEDASSYGFNAAHAYNMALDSLYIAYAKAHYPAQTYVALLRYWSENKNVGKLYQLKIEAQTYFGIPVLPMRFGQDNRKLHMEDGVIYQALSGVKYLNEETANVMYELRNFKGSYLELRDLLIERGVSKTKREVLSKIGYLQSIEQMGKALWIEDKYKEYTVIRDKNLKGIYNTYQDVLNISYEDMERDLLSMCAKRTPAQYTMKDPKDFFKYILTNSSVNDILSLQKMFFDVSLTGTTDRSNGYIGQAVEVNKYEKVSFLDLRTNDLYTVKLKDCSSEVQKGDILFFKKIEQKEWTWKRDGVDVQGTTLIAHKPLNLTALFGKGV